MAIIDDLLKQEQPVAQKSSWVQDLINSRYQNKGREKRVPVGFNFTREPFDPSSYYRSLELANDTSYAATEVAAVQAANRRAAQIAKEQEALRKQLAGIEINPKFTGGGGGSGSSTGGNLGSVVGKVGKKFSYKLGDVTSTTKKAAAYFGNKYGIRTIGGWRSHGSVPGSDHPKGRALDYMINNIKNGKKVGTALANDAVANYKKWNIKYVIWNRHIWQPGRGWRKYSGPSPHTDHVHISFNK